MRVWRRWPAQDIRSTSKSPRSSIASCWSFLLPCDMKHYGQPLTHSHRLRRSAGRGCGLGLRPQVLCSLREGHDATVLRMHVQEAHFVADLKAVEAALCDDTHVEAVAGCVHHGGPYAAAGRRPRHQRRVDIHLVQVPDEGGPEEAAGAALRNDEIFRLRPNLLDDGVANVLVLWLCGGQHALA